MTAKKGPKSRVTAILHYLPGTTIEVTDACPKEGASKLCGQTRIEQVVFIETLTWLFYQTVSRIPFLRRVYHQQKWSQIFKERPALLTQSLSSTKYG